MVRWQEVNGNCAAALGRREVLSQPLPRLLCLPCSHSIRHPPFGNREDGGDSIQIAQIEQHAFRDFAGHLSWGQIHDKQGLPPLDLPRVFAFLLYASEDCSCVITKVHDEFNQFLRTGDIINRLDRADSDIQLF